MQRFRLVAVASEVTRRWTSISTIGCDAGGGRQCGSVHCSADNCQKMDDKDAELDSLHEMVDGMLAIM